MQKYLNVVQGKRGTVVILMYLRYILDVVDSRHTWKVLELCHQQYVNPMYRQSVVKG